MTKVMTVVGTRPEIIKLSCVIPALDRHFDHTLVHTGQNYDYQLNQIFFDELGIRAPDHFLDAAQPTAVGTIAASMTKIEPLLLQVQPDAMLILGDTNSCMVCIAAKKHKIPIFHMEAGNRCFDQRVPEEVNRKIIDHTCDINLTYTEHARRYLLAEGLPADRVIKTGSPMYEVLNKFSSEIGESSILRTLDLEPGSYVVASVHREENVDSPENLGSLVRSLNAVAENFSKRVVFSVHPRTRKRLAELTAVSLTDQLQALEPLGFIDYVALQQHAFCVVSDSGTITEESAILNFPAITLRNAH